MVAGLPVAQAAQGIGVGLGILQSPAGVALIAAQHGQDGQDTATAGDDEFGPCDRPVEPLCGRLAFVGRKALGERRRHGGCPEAACHPRTQHAGIGSMTNAYCISGLARKRADLAAELHELEQRADQLRAGIAHLDAVLVMMEPGKPEEPRSKQYRPEWFGNLGRLVLEALRDAPEPMTSMQVAARVMELCGLETADRAMQEVVERRVAASLNRRIGLVEKLPRGARGVVWRVTASELPVA